VCVQLLGSDGPAKPRPCGLSYTFKYSSTNVQKSYDQHKFRADERSSQDLAPRIKRPQASARQRVVVEENGRCAVYCIHEERWLWERWYCQGTAGTPRLLTVPTRGPGARLPAERRESYAADHRFRSAASPPAKMMKARVS
jgi:hypothetical protein